MSKFQQGGLNAKRVRDHLFLLREVMDHGKSLGEKCGPCLILTT